MDLPHERTSRYPEPDLSSVLAKQQSEFVPHFEARMDTLVSFSASGEFSRF